MTMIDQNFEMYQGEIRRINLELKDESGAALDVSGLSFTWVLSRSADSTPLVTKTTPAGIIITSAVGGLGYFDLAKADTVGLAQTDYYHELRDTFDEWVLFTGRLTLRESNTA